MRKFLWPTLMSLAMLWTFASAASADSLTLTDGFGDVWTLNVQTSCTTCNVTLSADLTNAAAGDYIDAVQWVITNEGPTSVTLDSVTAAGADVTSDWKAPKLPGSLSGGNQCNGNASGSVCDQTNSAIGEGPIVGGTTWTWDFTAKFASALPDDLTSGNIRASFNDSTGKNVATFSPNGGDFTTTTTSTTTTTGEQTTTTTNGSVPEPGLLLLFGSGLTAAVTRMRRRNRRSTEAAS